MRPAPARAEPGPHTTTGVALADRWAAPTSAGPAGDPAAIVLDDIAGLRPRLAPDNHLRWLAGFDQIGTATDGRSLPGPALAPLQPRGRAAAESAVPMLLTDLVVTWDLPVATVAAALCISAGQVGRWRAGEPPTADELARLQAMHRAVAQVVGERIGAGARLRLTRPRGRLGPSHLARITATVRRDHPAPRPRPSARSLLLGVDVAVPVAGELVSVRAIGTQEEAADHA